MTLNVGDLVGGKYRIVRLIGDGGMGSVFEARHGGLGTMVALKVLHDDLVQRAGLVERFLQEARVSAAIQSPHVVRVTDVEASPGGGAYLVMELLHGETLRRILDRDRRVAPAVALDFTMQILAGLEAAHRLGVVHRDLKPDNVFVTASPHGPLVKILDFGIAKLRMPEGGQKGLTRPGVVMGTPEYMAPEQAFASDRVDARADIYAVGAMLYELLTGRRPAEGSDAQQIASLVVAGRVVPVRDLDPSISPELAATIHRAMAPDPASRHASVAELRDELLPHCGSISAVGRMAATPSPPPADPDAFATSKTGMGGVAPTLPPDDGGTRIPAAAKGHTAASFGDSPGWAPAPQASPYAAAAPASPAQPRAKARRGAPLGAIAGVLALVAAGLIAAGVVSSSRSASDDGPPPSATATGPTTATVAVLEPPPGGTAPATAPPPAQPPPQATGTTAHTPPRVGPDASLPEGGGITPFGDAGGWASPFDAGGQGVTIQLPPNPLGSALPIPMPTQITFPIPFPTAPPMTTTAPPKATSSAGAPK